MGCKYIIHNGDGTLSREMTHKELVRYFIEHGGQGDIADILYSKGGTRQDSMYQRVMKDKLEFKAKMNETPNNDAPDYADGQFTTQTFIDSGQFMIHGKRIMPQQSEEDYVKNQAALYEADGMTGEQALQKARVDVSNWHVINEDAMALHKVLNSLKHDRYNYIDMLKGTKFENLASDIFDQIHERNGTWHRMRSNHKMSDDQKTRIIQSVNLAAKLNFTGDEIIGHIDNLVIDTDGTLHVYNYKVTSTPWIKERNKVKMEKYKYQMALLKQILAYNGYEIKDVTLNIIPVRLKYNDDYSGIEKVIVYNNNIERMPQGQQFNYYDDVARNFVKSNLQLEPLTGEMVQRINKTLNHVFPQRNIKLEGIQKTAKEWVRKNYSARTGARIRKVDAEDHAYELSLDDNLEETIMIKDPTEPINNQEILEKVREHLAKENSANNAYLQKLVKDIRVGYRQKKSVLQNGSSSQKNRFLDQSLRKYIESTHSVGDDVENDWELLSDDTLMSANILVFRHYRTRQIDVVTLSDYDLRANLDTSAGHENIMGYYISDANKDTLGLINYKQNFSNIEAVKTMVILNEIIPNLLKGDEKLGELRILSAHGNGDMDILNFERLNGELFQNVIKIAKMGNKDFAQSGYKNNFTKIKYVDPVAQLIYDYDSMLASQVFDEETKETLKNMRVDGLDSMATKEAKIVQLRAIIEAIYKQFDAIRNMTPQEILNARYSGRQEDRALVNLYIDAQNAYCYYSGIPVQREYKISKLREYGMTQDRVNNRTYHGVVSRFVRSIDNIASQVRAEYNHIYNFTIDFYEGQGFGSFRNSTIGDNARAYRNLYVLDRSGRNTMRFRNPYGNDDQTSLSANERTYLKRVLFEFAKIRSEMYGINNFNFNRSNLDDPKLLEFIKENENWYFNVPLEKASTATSWTIPLKDKVKNWKEQVSKWRDGIAYFQEGILNASTNEEREALSSNSEKSQSIDRMTLYNPFTFGDGYTGREGERIKMLERHPDSYFETNVENLLSHYLEKNIQVREFNKELIAIKGTLLQLQMINATSNSDLNQGTMQTMKMIEDFVKLNMFNTSIMEPESQKLMGWLMPFRSLVSKAYIAGNIVSCFRDTFEGVWQNYTRAVTKFKTDISAKDVTRAYKDVVRACFTSIRDITVIDELCKTYRLSNLDIARISEGLTTSRGGALNFENWMYETLKRPDFLNRMTLFVARCMHDGCWEAFDLKDGKLVYDWRKDKRFSAYADPSKKGTKEYVEQRNLYRNKIRQYNQENPDHEIEFTDDLPVAYSNVEIQQFREFSNSIYGAYDKSIRQKFEHTALGMTFGMFATWMNGMISNYTAAPFQYVDGMNVLEQETDGSGNLMFMDGKKNVLTQIKNGDDVYYVDEITGERVNDVDLDDLTPIMRGVPRVIQGILPTVKQAFEILRKWDTERFQKEIWADPMQRANIKKLLSDFLLICLFSALFKLAVTPAYKEYKKKDMKDNPAIMNAMAEILYKSSSRSYDGYLGIVAPIEYLGENTNPPPYALSQKVVTDLAKVVFGDKTVNDMFYGNIAIFRSFQDTYKAEKKKEQIEEKENLKRQKSAESK